MSLGSLLGTCAVFSTIAFMHLFPVLEMDVFFFPFPVIESKVVLLTSQQADTLRNEFLGQGIMK